MKYIRIARIVNTFGIKGDIKVISETDFPEERFKPGQQVLVLNQGQVMAESSIVSSWQNKGTYIIHLEGYETIESVEPFKNCWLAIDEKDQESLSDDSFYYHEIIGLTVYDDQNTLIGTIQDILALGSNDVWVIKPTKAGQKDILIPYIDDFVKEVDLDGQRVTVTLLEGLIDDAH